MKTFFFILLAAVSSSSVWACGTMQAQIIAKISDVSYHNEDYCDFAVRASDIIQFNPSTLCPLDIDEVRNVRALCRSYEVGGFLSGVIYRDGQIPDPTIYLE